MITSPHHHFLFSVNASNLYDIIDKYIITLVLTIHVFCFVVVHIFLLRIYLIKYKYWFNVVGKSTTNLTQNITTSFVQKYNKNKNKQCFMQHLLKREQKLRATGEVN